MSIQGKGNLSYKKQNVQKQNAPHTGVKNITFAHLFSNAGETFIPFDALVTPPEWPTSGLVNPTTQSLLSAQLQVFKNNVTVTSSARGLIQKSEYIVHANRIEFKNITSLVNEVFEVEVADILVTGNTIVDMQTIRVEGELLNGNTDFNMGYAFDVLNEEIIVFRNGVQLFRSDNNDSSGATGNYYYLNEDENGKSSIIRFFEAATWDEPILIATTGGVVDSANVSTFQQIEHLAGQLDAIVPTVAALAGVPESNFRSGPNSVDLRAFGDLLVETRDRVNAIENLEIDVYSLQETIYLANDTNNGTISDQAFSTETQIEGGLSLFQKINTTEIEILQDCTLHYNYRWVNGGVSNTATDILVNSGSGYDNRGAVVVPPLTIEACLNGSIRVRQGDLVKFRTYLTHNNQVLNLLAERSSKSKIGDLI